MAADNATVAILKQDEAGLLTAELCRQHGIAEQTYYRWKAKYGGMENGGIIPTVVRGLAQSSQQFSARGMDAQYPKVVPLGMQVPKALQIVAAGFVQSPESSWKQGVRCSGVWNENCSDTSEES